MPAPKLTTLNNYNIPLVTPKNYDLNKKVMVFSFYLTEDYKERRANKIHHFCLNKYSNIFDEIIMTILVDDITNEKLIDECKHWLLDCLHCKSVTLKVDKGTKFCESMVFFKEIASKIDELYGLYFFGHNKGVTNYDTYPDNMKDIDMWLIGMYYLNFNFIDEVERSLIFSTRTCFYGAFMTDEVSAEDFRDSKTYYNGTFYWINPTFLPDGKIPLLSHRGYAELFPIFVSKPTEKTSHGWKYMPYNRFNPYTDMSDYMHVFLFKEEERNDFYSLYDAIIKNVK